MDQISLRTKWHFFSAFHLIHVLGESFNQGAHAGRPAYILLDEAQNLEARIPIEVKYRKRINDHDDTRGLRAFLEKTVYNAPFGILVTLEDDVKVFDPRIIAISLSSLLWMR